MVALVNSHSPAESTTCIEGGTVSTSNVSLQQRFSRNLYGRPRALIAMGNLLALTTERFVRLGIALIITASLARMLGPAEFGIYSTIVMVTTTLASTSDLGTSRVVVRELVRQNSPLGLLLGTAFLARLMGCLLTSSISFLVSALMTSSIDDSVRLVAASFAIGYVLRAVDVVDYGFQAKSHCAYPVAVRSVVMMAMAAVQFWMIHMRMPMWSFAIAFIAESLLASIGLILMWNHLGIAPIREWSYSRTLLSSILREGWPVFAAALLSTIYYKSDLLIVNRLCDAHEAGLYASASRLYDMMVATIPMLTVAIFPMLTRWYDDPLVSFRHRYVMLTRCMTLVSMVILGLILFFSQQVMQFFYGPSFVDASHFLAVSCFSALLMANGFLRSSYLNLASRQQVLLWTSLVSAIVNVGLNYTFVSFFGAIGASYAGLITQLISLTFLNLLWPDTRWLTFAHFGIVLRESRLEKSALESA